MQRLLLLIVFMLSAITLFGQNKLEKSGYIKVQNVKLYYEIYGKGEPLLFMHGGLDSGANYNKLIARLSDHFQVIAVDRRGHGKSYDNDLPYNYAQQAEEMKEFIDSLQLKSIHLFGYSDGGIIGLQLSSKYPDLVKKNIAVAPNYTVDGAFSPAEKEAVLNMTENDYPDIAASYHSVNPSNTYSQYLAKMKQLWLTEPIISKEEMEQIKVKTLFVAGDSDMIPLEHMIEMYRLVKHSQLFILPNTSHFIFQDLAFKPITDSFIDICIQFLRSE